MQTSRRWQLAIAALGATALLSACVSNVNDGLTANGPTSGSTGTTGPSASQPRTPAAGPSASCAQITALGKALAKVSHITVNARTGSQISADLTAIETALTALKNDAPSLYTAEAGQIVGTMAVIGKQAPLLSSHPTTLNRKVIQRAINELKTAANSATTGMRLACPSA